MCDVCWVLLIPIICGHLFVVPRWHLFVIYLVIQKACLFFSLSSNNTSMGMEVTVSMSCKVMHLILRKGWECNSVGTALDQHATDTSLIPWCGKGIFSQWTFRCRLSYGACTLPCATAYIDICAHVKDTVVHVRSLVDYGSAKTPCMHHRLGNAILSQLSFPRKSNPNFQWKKSKWDNRVAKKKLKYKTIHLHSSWSQHLKKTNHAPALHNASSSFWQLS